MGPVIKTLSLAQMCEMMDIIKIRQTQITQSYCDLSRQAENAQKEGYLNLAKARYVQGPQSISKNRLPTENSEECGAIVGVTVNEVDEVDPIDDSVFRYKQRELEILKDPAKETKLLKQIAGVLPTGCVKEAQKNFRKALELHVERANILEELDLVQRKFHSLEIMKKIMVEKNINTVAELMEVWPQNTKTE